MSYLQFSSLIFLHRFALSSYTVAGLLCSWSLAGARVFGWQSSVWFLSWHDPTFLFSSSWFCFYRNGWFHAFLRSAALLTFVESSGLWGAFFRASYRLSLAFICFLSCFSVFIAAFHPTPFICMVDTHTPFTFCIVGLRHVWWFVFQRHDGFNRSRWMERIGMMGWQDPFCELALDKRVAGLSPGR